MTGQHAKPTVYFGADHEKVRRYIDDAVAAAINEAAHAIRAVREWCDRQQTEIDSCPLGHDPHMCPPCSARAYYIAEIRALLPDVPRTSGEHGGENAHARPGTALTQDP